MYTTTFQKQSVHSSHMTLAKKGLTKIMLFSEDFVGYSFTKKTKERSTKHEDKKTVIFHISIST